MYKIGIVSPGKMGSSLFYSLDQSNEFFCALEGRSEKTVRSAEGLGLKNTRTLNLLFRECDFIFSIGTGGTAFDTIISAVENNYSGIYVDFNTLFGEQSENDLNKIVLENKINFVDAVLYGWPISSFEDTKKERFMYLYGENALKVKNLFKPNYWEMSILDQPAKKYRRTILS
jgi:hypothetical protein